MFWRRPPTCNHHGGFSFYIFLFPRALVEFLLPKGHLIGFDVPPLRVLGGKVEWLAPRRVRQAGVPRATMLSFKPIY